MRASSLGMLAALLLASATASAAPQPGFGLDTVRALARSLAEQPYRASENSVPRYLLDLDYDSHRDIRFKPPRSIWRDKGLPFQLQFFHLGLYFNRPVAINLVEHGVARRFPFDPSLFDYGRNRFPEALPPDLGYAGFRVHNRINRKDYFDEVIVFVGASYFRAVAKDLRYGLSARGIAIDTAIDGPEEFPYFKEFWIVEPSARAKQIEIYALLDGPSVAGPTASWSSPARTRRRCSDLVRAIRRGGSARAAHQHVLARGEQRDRFRRLPPRVHDSDGLLMHAGSGEWIWRPLRNPMQIELSAFQDRNPRGFGLLQRERDFVFYQDLEAHYENRPSAWIEPVGDWGAGSVVLLEMPSDIETNDNIVAFWEPKDGPKLGEPFDMAYRLHWYGTTRRAAPRRTRCNPDRSDPDRRTRAVIDFGQGELPEAAPGRR
jgi:glucans biosynthesis protein